MPPTIRQMTIEDLIPVAAIHQQNFIRQHDSVSWINCHLLSFPKDIVYVLEQNDTLVGYIIWSQKSGFRTKVVLELSQVAIAVSHHRQGFGKQLILASLKQINQYFTSHNQTLSRLLIATSADNPAKKLYESLLNAKAEAKFHHLYNLTDDEIILVARDFDDCLIDG